MQRRRILTHTGLGLWCALACGGRVTGSNHEGLAQGGTLGSASAAGSAATAPGAGGSILATGSVASGARSTSGRSGADANRAGNAGNDAAGGAAGSNSTAACPSDVAGAASGQCPDMPPAWPDCCKFGDFQPADTASGTANTSAPERLTRVANTAALANAVREGAKPSVFRQYSAYWSIERARNCASIPTHHATADANSPCVPAEEPMPVPTLDPPPPNLQDPAPGPDSNDAQRGTNYAVAGLEMPDRWHFDELNVYVLTSTGLLILDVKDASNAVVVARLPLEGTGKGLLVAGTKALVIADADASSPSRCNGPYDCQFWGDGHATQLSIIDLTDRKNPRLTHRVQLSGAYIGGGMGGSHAQIVTADGLAGPTISWSAPSVGVTSTAAEAMARLTAQYQEAIASLAAANVGFSSPSAKIFTILDDGSSQPPAVVNPQDVYWSRGLPSSAVSITSLDLGADTQVRQQLVYTRPGAVHITSDLLWLAVPEYQDDSNPPGEDTTWIHGFASSSTTTQYRGSGRIDGHVSNRFTLDQRHGDFRIATTTSKASYQNVPKQSTLSVLGWKGDQLSLSSAVSQIAPGRYLHAVHFAGPRAYATLVDSCSVPVFDLSDATAAKTLGELNLAGIAAYVHALDERRVVTIGSDAQPGGGNVPFYGVTLQVIDLVDPAKPKVLSSTTLGTLGTMLSNADTLADNMSLRYFADQNMLAMPMNICESSGNGKFADVPTFTGLLLYDVSADWALTPRGRVTFPSPSGYYDNSAEPTCSTWWSVAASPVTRSAVVGSYIFGLGGATLEISSVASPGQVVASHVVGEIPCDSLDESTCATNLHCLPIRGVRLASGNEEYLGCASTRTGWPGPICTKSTNCATNFSSLDCATVQSSCVPHGWGKLGAASCTAALCGG